MGGGAAADLGSAHGSRVEPRERRAEELVRGHADFVYRCLSRLGVAEADLQDLAQETFLVALRKDEDWTDAVRTRPWLYGVARRIAAAHRRRAYRRREQSSDVLDHRPNPSESPEDLVARSQAQRRLGAILEAMTLDQRAAFVMFEIEGMSGREIAELSGLPLQTVFSRLRRARQVFERAVEEE